MARAVTTHLSCRLSPSTDADTTGEYFHAKDGPVPGSFVGFDSRLAVFQTTCSCILTSRILGRIVLIYWKYVVASSYTSEYQGVGVVKTIPRRFLITR